VNCCDVDTSTTGEEVSLLRIDDSLGFVYQLDTGPSFDGDDLFAYITPAWITQVAGVPEAISPRPCSVCGIRYAAVDFGYGLGDNSPLIGQPSSTSYESAFSVALWTASLGQLLLGRHHDCPDLCEPDGDGAGHSARDRL